MRPRYRVACFVTHPTQYHAPMLRHIAAQSEIDLTVFFLSNLSVHSHKDIGFGVNVTWDIDLLSGYQHEFLPVLGDSKRVDALRPFAYGLGRRLRKGKFDALWLHGYAHQVNLRAMLVAKALGIKVLLRGDSQLYGRRTNTVKESLRRVILPILFSSVDGFLAVGTLNREYYLHYGVPESRIFTMPFAVDNGFFQVESRNARERREELRSELQLDAGRPVILYASKLQTRKRPGDLLEAYRRLSIDARSEPKPYLLFVGDGEERKRLENQAATLDWKSIRFLGFRNQTELPRYFDLCDVFVLPAQREPWALVVNEVMNAGKPVIVTRDVGCAPDLVRDGENGFVVPVGDIGLLSQHLRTLTDVPELAKEMGQRSLERIRNWGFGEGYQALLQALRTLVN